MTSYDNEPPSKVTGLSVTDANDGKLNLVWNHATDNVGIDHYNIYRDGDNEPVVMVPYPTNSYQDTGLTNGKVYTYQVSAVDTSENEGEKSDPETGTPTVTENSDSNNNNGNKSPNNKPVADAGGPYLGYLNESINFDGSRSYDVDRDIVSYNWDLGNNDVVTGISPEYIYSEVGNYTITLTVTDSHGNTDADMTYVLITEYTNRPSNKPVVNGASTGSKDINYTYTVIATDPEGDLIKYVFDWGDGNLTVTDFYPEFRT